MVAFEGAGHSGQVLAVNVMTPNVLFSRRPQAAGRLQ